MRESSINIKNKKAFFDYEIVERFVAGIVLTGTEIKSIRQGQVNFTDAYCFILKQEMWIKGLHISEYSHGNIYNHEPKRDRKLLLNSREIKKISTKVKEKGFTIVPLKMFINGNGFAKVEISLARGKAQHDKRETLKKKDATREIERRDRY
ncbi:MAG TPA: SsrA-binding protein [Bacteroidales bacterium]|nr:MAG: SsrA-binding protein [Bacteroidetes bacterium GWF2_33_38]OFY73638.1 MAG: SsrA-binding protein [Bacteroidetes bacterium RIFOXYA12_FULL_33_9]HBF89176.1 SsrA-binding protein [Bacteroidales bacterium]